MNTQENKDARSEAKTPGKVRRGLLWAAFGGAAVLVVAGAVLGNEDTRTHLSGRLWHLARRFDPAVLVGRWQRPDGGYIIGISRVQPSGKLEARYFNPNPIHVARAEVRNWERAHGFFLELQDKGYPGSTYNLSYLPEQDCLAGWYCQAAIGENLDVQFERDARSEMTPYRMRT